MRLVDLEPQFLRYVVIPDPHNGIEHHTVDGIEHHYVDTIGEADGIMFLCPKCFQANSGRIGTHRVICWSPRVPPDAHPKPGRWELVGTGYADLSLRAGSSSVLLDGGCRWHGFVNGGEVTL